MMTSAREQLSGAPVEIRQEPGYESGIFNSRNFVLASSAWALPRDETEAFSCGRFGFMTTLTLGTMRNWQISQFHNHAQ